MARAEITPREIETMRTASRRSGKAVYLWDSRLKGLGLCVGADGKGQWLVQKWIGGRRGKMARLVIGQYPPMTVDEARQEARSRAPRATRQAQRDLAEPAAASPQGAR